MRIVETGIDGVIEVIPVRHGDGRGWFSEVFKLDALNAVGIDLDFVQDNESYSAAVGTIGGLHYQIDPHRQAKLVRAVRGALLDVAVDIRRSSPTFGHHVAVTLSADIGNQLLVPAGCAHGFCTIEPDTQIGYKVTDRYAPECERSIRWDDPELDISWPLDSAPVLSDRDARAPLLADQPDLFA